ncbi:MAG: sigma-70 family RNA polymerase sigma factor [Promicromonosporaceae bacterium]|nr:sigma-70 family RNA polymerase sigma factor [Promicromonosporaceae bacterium]
MKPAPVANPADDLVEFESSDDVLTEVGQFVSGATADPVRDYLRQIARFGLLTPDEEIDLARRVEVGLYVEHLLCSDPRWANYSHGRSGDERRRQYRDLLWVMTDGRRARDRLVEANLRLVVFLAKRYTGHGLPFLDLIQEGNVGLIHAVSKFDYALGHRFATYAIWWIRSAIEQGLATKSRTIRLPGSVMEIVSRLAVAQRELLQALGRVPTVDELAAELDLAPARVVEVQQLNREPVSLDVPTEEGGSELGDLIEDVASIDPLESVAAMLLQAQLRAVLQALGERELEVISLRYGLRDGRRQTLQTIGKRLGLTIDQVRQIELEALTLLRDPSLSRALYDLSH